MAGFTIEPNIHTRSRPEFSGLLSGLVPGPLQSWGLLEVLPLFPAQPQAKASTAFAPALRSLKIVDVPSYGSMVLRNTCMESPVIIPMHIGFFQVGAQNHATSRVLVLDAGETLRADDCFCIQQAQGGLMKESQQRFLMLPLPLRAPALRRRHEADFGRLWNDINHYTSSYGIRRGGHLERFFRPYFDRLVPFRHGLEPLPDQVGAAYFLAGKLVGIEVTPDRDNWEDLSAVFSIYGYAPAALRAERHKWTSARTPVDLDDLHDLDDLAERLRDTRERERETRLARVEECSKLSWDVASDESRHGLSIVTVEKDGWLGQFVRQESDLVSLSVFRDMSDASE